MSKGRFSGSIRLGGVAAVVLAAAWVGCNGWQGVSTENASLVSPNGAITQGADESRTNWYNNQPGLDPSIVGGPNFKQLFSTALPSTGEPVLAQPLYIASPTGGNGTVLIVTEENNVYLLDAVTGAVKTTRSLGAGFDASAAPIG